MKKVGTAQVVDVTTVRNSEKNKFLPIHKQEVRDEKGRKRLHGAFTGGFSAGYYNTVGSQEGWAPSSFQSSRAQRANLSQAPQDYMDDEDLEHLKKDIEITEDYDSARRDVRQDRKKQRMIQDMQSTAGGIFSGSARIAQVFLGPPPVSIGVQIMKRLGWRDGHGVGPRRKRRKEDQQDIHAQDHLFASKEAAQSDNVSVKKNLFGVGYDPVKNAPEFAAHAAAASSSSLVRDRAFLGIEGGGFGEGIFDDEDDYDVYGSNTISYDISRGAKSLMPPEPEEKEEDTKLITAPDSRVGFDGKVPLPGFTFARDVIPPFRGFSGPRVPDNFKPNPPLVGTRPRRNAEPLDPDSRRDILGEEKLEGPIQKYMYTKFLQHEKRAVKEEPKVQPAASEDKGNVSAKTAEQALNATYNPYAANPGKQERYHSFLKAIIEGKSSTEAGADLPSNEHSEFTKCANMFQGLNSVMSTRFVTQGDAVPVPESKKRDRVVSKWVPDRLLCKRMNIADPYPESRVPEGGFGGMEPKQTEESIQSWLKMDNIESGPSAASDEPMEEDEANMERPSMDLFKAIFADSDEEDDESSDEEPSEHPPAAETAPKIVERASPLPNAFKPTFRKKGDRSITRTSQKIVSMQTSFRGKEDDIVVVDPESMQRLSGGAGITEVADIPIVHVENASLKRKKSKKKKKDKKRRSDLSFDVEDWEEA